MVDKNMGNVIEFDMSEILKFKRLRAHIYVIWGASLFCLAYILIGFLTGQYSTRDKASLFLVAGGIWGLFMFLTNLSRIMRKKERMPLKLKIDTLKKEFWALLSITNEEVKFKTEDIEKVEKNMMILTFYLKDGTRINWGIDPKTEPLLESTLSSLGVLINIKPFSWF